MDLQIILLGVVLMLPDFIVLKEFMADMPLVTLPVGAELFMQYVNFGTTITVEVKELNCPNWTATCNLLDIHNNCKSLLHNRVASTILIPVENPNISLPKATIACECGSHKIGSNNHSSWCAAYVVA